MNCSHNCSCVTDSGSASSGNSSPCCSLDSDSGSRIDCCVDRGGYGVDKALPHLLLLRMALVVGIVVVAGAVAVVQPDSDRTNCKATKKAFSKCKLAA